MLAEVFLLLSIVRAKILVRQYIRGARHVHIHECGLPFDFVKYEAIKGNGPRRPAQLPITLWRAPSTFPLATRNISLSRYRSVEDSRRIFPSMAMDDRPRLILHNSFKIYAAVIIGDNYYLSLLFQYYYRYISKSHRRADFARWLPINIHTLATKLNVQLMYCNYCVFQIEFSNYQ